MSGSLVLCATPIGNLGDVSRRLSEALAAADVIFAEDTRRTRRLLNHLGISATVRSYFAGNEAARARELRDRLQAGDTVAFVTDAGTPGISDPGYSAVQAALEVQANVTVIPGPTAVIAALVASGLPSDRFVFEGFLPRRGKSRSERIAALGIEPRTIVVLTTKEKLRVDLADLSSSLGGHRRCAVARELTKLHEEIWRGTLEEGARHWSAVEPRGEFTLVVEGAPSGADLRSAVAECLALMEAGSSTADAVRSVAESSGVSRRYLYEAVIRRMPN